MAFPGHRYKRRGDWKRKRLRLRIRVRFTQYSRPLGLDAHAPARGYFAMASGMVRAAAVAFQEEKEGLETSKSESLVSFCKKFLSTICENEKKHRVV